MGWLPKVRLNGLVQTDDTIALKEIARQLRLGDQVPMAISDYHSVEQSQALARFKAIDNHHFLNGPSPLVISYYENALLVKFLMDV